MTILGLGIEERACFPRTPPPSSYSVSISSATRFVAVLRIAFFMLAPFPGRGWPGAADAL
jgi:hypothetical protein